MNMLDVQDKLKGLSEQQLVQEMQMPSGSAPQFLVLSEITRRKRMRDSMQQQPDNTTVAQEAVAAAGVPQGGIADMAQALAPKTDMTQNTGAMPVQGMYGGGYVQKMQPGGLVALQRNPAALAYAQREAQRLGMTLEQYVSRMGLPPQARGAMDSRPLDRFLETQADRNRMLGFEPVGDGAEFPSQSDLDRRFQQQQQAEQFAFGASNPLTSPGPLDADVGMPPQAGRVIGAQSVASVAPQMPPMQPRSPDAAPEIFDATVDIPPPQPSAPIARGPVFEELGREVGGASILDMANTASALTPQVESERPTYPGWGANTDMKPYQTLSDIRAFLSGEYGGDADAAPTAEELMSGLTPSDIEAGKTPSPPDPASVVTVPDRDRQAFPSVPQVDGVKPAPTVNDLIADTTTGGTRTSGGAGGAGSASGATSYEQELMNAMQRAERRAQQDKWLALAQVGLGLMSSTQPTLGGALGEAGLAGLQSYQGARDEYETERLGLSKELAGIEAARASQRAAAAKTRSGPSIKDISDRLELITTDEVDDLGNKTGKRVPISDKYAGAVAQYEQMLLDRMGAEVAPTM